MLPHTTSTTAEHEIEEYLYPQCSDLNINITLFNNKIFNYFSNLLLPQGAATERQRTRFVFDLYRGEDLMKINPSNQLIEDNFNSYVTINFAGVQVLEHYY